MRSKHNPPKDQRLITIIKHYKDLRARKPDTWMEFAVSQPTLRKAIIASSLCVNQNNKRNPHQYRIPQAVLEQTKNELLENIRKVRKAKSFQELFEIVDSLEIYGLGELTVYDIATRIGAFMGLFPDRVYLHAGTKAGAKKLLGAVNKDYLMKSELPEAFRGKGLSCIEIEDILCIYKNLFGSKSIMMNRKERAC